VVEKELNKWTQQAMNPEVEVAFEAITSASFAATVGAKDRAQATGEGKFQEKENEPRLRHYLLETESALKEAISTLTLREGLHNPTLSAGRR
jgi:hypothetical protein